MATYNSTQMAKVLSVDFDMLKPTELHGRVRVAFFDFTTPASGNADGDIYRLTRIPKGARVIDVVTVNEALGASVVAKIGTAASDAKYGSAIDMAAAGQDRAAATVATYGLETTAEEDLIMTLTGAAPAASKVVKGHVLYVVD